MRSPPATNSRKDFCAVSSKINCIMTRSCVSRFLQYFFVIVLYSICLSCLIAQKALQRSKANSGIVCMCETVSIGRSSFSGFWGHAFDAMDNEANALSAQREIPLYIPAPWIKSRLRVKIRGVMVRIPPGV